MPENQCKPNEGPVPNGAYKILLVDSKSNAVDDGTGNCKLSPSWQLQTIPRGSDAGDCEPFWANWGSNRIRFEPADTTTKQTCAPIKRSGFYLHDSTKGYSHGCIEIESKFFTTLRQFIATSSRKWLFLSIKYIPGVSTNGDTYIEAK